MVKQKSDEEMKAILGEPIEQTRGPGSPDSEMVPPTRTPRWLKSITGIAAYMNRSEGTVMNLIKHQGLPAGQEREKGIWFADADDIDEWRRDRIEREMGKRTRESSPVLNPKRPPNW